ncbi:uncharacterized protein GGS22DRAFT_23349 [Annulohypoxylon maeteangense]|uniref:uncharacterized protein n=1 Tax=Annulohypoxylon maeteangense TaxID=1927788 RepID=UPI0020079685|nr:uncharacterized protein GGS22DRAFT_23349 [Annulohypoxylon maeteangense]KAI0884452.1 hypothetical protein GGS22DRAFT_23349 [Annulohypoxylon maeteangense]
MDDMTEQADISMEGTSGVIKAKKAHELVTATIKAPRHSYAHLELFSDSPDTGDLDILQVRSYCTSALKQFLGATGIGIPLDILKVEGKDCWLRVPRDDLGAFSAAITAWQGSYQDGIHSSFRIRGCSDWLGALVGSAGNDKIWSG